MKTTITVLALICAFIQVQCILRSKRTVAQKATLDADEEECVSELHLDRAKIEKLDNEEVPPDDDPDFNAYALCDFKKKGLLTDKEEISFTKLEDYLVNIAKTEGDVSFSILEAYKILVKMALEPCKALSTPGTASGQTVVKIHNCLVESFKNIQNKLVD